MQPASQTKNKVFFYGWVILIASLTIGIISFGIRYSFGVFFDSLETEFGLSRAATSGIFSVYMILCGISSVIGGWALDRFGPRKVALIMGLFTGLSLILSSQVHSAWLLYFSYSVLLAIGTGALFSVVSTTTTRWFNRKRGMAIGITSSAGAIGEVFMAPLSTVLISHFDWRVSFIILGGMAWIILVPAALLMKRDPSDVGLLPDGVKPETAAASRSKTAGPEEGLLLSQAWKVREFWFLTITWFLLSISVNLILTHATPHAVDLGISSIDAALIISLIGVGSIVGRLIDGRLSDKVGRKPPAITGAVLMFCSLIALMFIQNLWLFYVFAVVFGYGWGGLGSQVTLLIGDIFGIRRLGLIMGMITLGWNFGAAIGPALGGMIFDATGSYSIAFGVAAAGMAIATFFAIIIRPEKAGSR
jgi:MFS family permease